VTLLAQTFSCPLDGAFVFTVVDSAQLHLQPYGLQYILKHFPPDVALIVTVVDSADITPLVI
jgi:hypothetical protein